MERLVVEGKVEGKRNRGRSPLRWADQIKSITGYSTSRPGKRRMDINHKSINITSPHPYEGQRTEEEDILVRSGNKELWSYIDTTKYFQLMLN